LARNFRSLLHILQFMRKTLLTVLLVFVSLYLADMSLSSCATRSRPGGGPRDTIAPRLDTSFPPNLTTNFKQQKVELIFDEYITVKGGSQQINFSPPLENKPQIEPGSKSIIISWEDSLRPNTTYTISFGNSITDFREGNANNDFKFIFSTGDFIDSLSFRGQVVDAKTAEPIKEMLVALYEPVDSISLDSLPFKKLPTYYAYTDETGNFEMNYLKYGSFQLVSFKDARGDFKLKTGKEMLAFANDLITTKPDMEPVKLVASQAPPSPRFLGDRYVDPGHLQLSFNFETDSLQLSIPNEDRLDNYFTKLNPGKDTLDIWFQPFLTDSLTLIYSEKNLGTDTITASLREMNPATVSLQALKSKVRYNDSLRLKSNLPLSDFGHKEVTVYSAKDTSKLAGDSLISPFEVLLFPATKSKSYEIVIPPGAVFSEFGQFKDSTTLSITTLSREQLGSLELVVKADTNLPLLLEIERPKGQLLTTKSFRDSTQLSLKNLPPGQYKARLITDLNEDGKWTAGSFSEQRQPEKIMTYSEGVEVRENWEMEMEWIAKIRSLYETTTPADSTQSTKVK